MELITNKGIEKINIETKVSEKRIDFEFQQVGIELEPFYGKVIWSIFYKYPLSKIKDAHKVCLERGILDIKYLIGVMKRLN